MILDLRQVNLYIVKFKFKMEDLRNFKETFNQGDLLFKFDLKSGYHHVDIFEDHQTYLGFSWKFNNITRFFVFTVLPFGLSSAPYIFTKLLIPLKKKWRSQGITNYIFIDDGIVKDQNDAVRVIRKDLSLSGFLVNELAKSVWASSQVIEWLGSIINSNTGIFLPTQRRIDKLLLDLSLFVPDSNPSFHVKKVANIVGQIISMSFFFGDIVHLMTRNLYRSIAQSESWDEFICLSSDSWNELKFWKNSLSSLPGRCVWNLSKTEVIVYSDASDTGYAGYALKVNNSIAHGQWSSDEACKSSTWKELEAVKRILFSLKQILTGKAVKWYSDSQNVVSIVKRGSSKPALHHLALDIFWTCSNAAITLEIEWISRDYNKRADQLSRIIDIDDWFINDFTFEWLDRIWGPHTIDRFANVFNKKLLRYNSRFWNPGCEAVDAFTQDWEGDNNWLVPPVNLILRVIKHLKECNASGTLIVPFWTSGVFWPVLCPDSVHFASFVHDVKYIENGNSVIMKGKSKNSLFGNDNAHVSILALKMSFEFASTQSLICLK